MKIPVVVVVVVVVAVYVPPAVSEITEWPVCELGGTYSVAHKIYCDKYFTCRQGKPYLEQCVEGQGFVPYTGCKPLSFVDCAGRIKLREPVKQPGRCPYLYGLFPDPNGCYTFIDCYDGVAAVKDCPPTLVFDSYQKICRFPTDQEKITCHPAVSNAVTGFRCPIDDPFKYGDHSRHPYPGNCTQFIMCLRDGSIKIGSCGPTTSYSPVTENCENASSVQGCGLLQ
ncbi:uncharacterized protein [Anabrus simplex]|uniref:uncharacterized protein n=1 Tax=Anabrus simplex TaxID=316456 RepID=UPI0035A339F9